ncbi:HAD-IA family hydrolase [Streptomyces sp. 4F14]|uniref:HAD-IA family hydrolase n=1 Tax=Streptomyces sp. 4F14 TaxID=3394380 RepID=UPI003A8C285A
MDTVVCDVGGVIIRFGTDVARQIEARHGLARGSLLTAALKSSAGRRAMAGEITYADWKRSVAGLVGEAAVEDWLSYHGELEAEVVALLKKSRGSGARVVLLSNATARLFDDLAFHGVAELADRVLCSARMGLVKPDPRCFREAARVAEFALERALYVDDTASWVAAGVHLGMTGHVFSTAKDLRDLLESTGLVS